MAICKVCEQEMKTAKGCVYGLIKLTNGDLMKRSLKHWAEPDERCGDCGAIYGNPHHWGCDVERCPLCSGQLISCDCPIDSLVSQ